MIKLGLPILILLSGNPSVILLSKTPYAVLIWIGTFKFDSNNSDHNKWRLLYIKISLWDQHKMPWECSIYPPFAEDYVIEQGHETQQSKWPILNSSILFSTYTWSGIAIMANVLWGINMGARNGQTVEKTMAGNE